MTEVFNAKIPSICTDCNAVTYPPQGFCHSCLSENTEPIPLPLSGKVMAVSQIHHSFEVDIQPHLPLSLTSVALTSDTVVFGLTKENELQTGDKVSLDVQSWPFGNLLTARST